MDCTSQSIQYPAKRKKFISPCDTHVLFVERELDSDEPLHGEGYDVPRTEERCHVRDVVDGPTAGGVSHEPRVHPRARQVDEEQQIRDRERRQILAARPDLEPRLYVDHEAEAVAHEPEDDDYGNVDHVEQGDGGGEVVSFHLRQARLGFVRVEVELLAYCSQRFAEQGAAAVVRHQCVAADVHCIKRACRRNMPYMMHTWFYIRWES